MPELRESLNAKLTAKPSAESMPIFWRDIDAMKEDAEALGMLRGSSADSSSAERPPPSATEHAEQTIPPANAEPSTVAAEQAQTEKAKAPRKRRTQEEIRKSLEEPFEKAISHFSKHGLENQTAKLKVIECNDVLTLGFGVKASGRVIDLRKRVVDEISKGRSDCMF